jgi:hypothetical protein
MLCIGGGFPEKSMVYSRLDASGADRTDFARLLQLGGGFFLVLDTALVTSSPRYFLFALLEANEDSLYCLMETSFVYLLHGSARGHRVGKDSVQSLLSGTSQVYNY